MKRASSLQWASTRQQYAPFACLAIASVLCRAENQYKVVGIRHFTRPKCTASRAECQNLSRLFSQAHQAVLMQSSRRSFRAYEKSPLSLA